MKKVVILKRLGRHYWHLGFLVIENLATNLRIMVRKKCSVGITNKKLCKIDCSISDHINWKCIKWTCIFLEVIRVSMEIRRDPYMIPYGFYLDIFSDITQPIICFVPMSLRSRGSWLLGVFSQGLSTFLKQLHSWAVFWQRSMQYLGKVNSHSNIFQTNSLRDLIAVLC